VCVEKHKHGDGAKNFGNVFKTSRLFMIVIIISLLSLFYKDGQACGSSSMYMCLPLKKPTEFHETCHKHHLCLITALFYEGFSCDT
jgi:hypothetical protein